MEMSTAVLESLYRFTLDHDNVDAIMTPRISYLPPATAAVITADLTGAKIPAKIGGLLSILGTIIYYDTILYCTVSLARKGPRAVHPHCRESSFGFRPFRERNRDEIEAKVGGVQAVIIEYPSFIT